MGAYKLITYEVKDRVAILMLNRADKLNALNTSLFQEIHAAFDEAESDEAAGAVLLHGAGRAFCVGSDLNEIGSLTGAAQRRFVHSDFTNKNRIASCRKPVVAAVHGYT